MITQLTLVFGYICSGKTTHANSIGDSVAITMSDIVKKMIPNQKRIDLQQTSHLSANIITELRKNIIQMKGNLVIDGIRQLNIVDDVLLFCRENNIVVDMVWLDVSKDERQKRFTNRNEMKDIDGDLDVFDERDKKMGLEEIKQKYFKSCYKYSVVYHEKH